MSNTIELFDRIEDAVSDWFPHRSGMEFQIRAVPAAEQRRLTKKYVGKEHKVTATEEGRVTKIDQDKTDAFMVERAVLAFMDTRPGTDPEAAIRISGEALAEKFAQALGRPVKVGERLKLHGVWTREAKELFMRLSPDDRDWVNEKSVELTAGEAEAEGKGEST